MKVKLYLEHTLKYKYKINFISQKGTFAGLFVVFIVEYLFQFLDSL